ncbi:MAG TPA: DUF6496 domain-containing protein [Thermoanaerobaculia bacterium]|nr:DUF6496 domain-containing protein [Thermoanaerobaculia bacterium]
MHPKNGSRAVEGGNRWPDTARRRLRRSRRRCGNVRREPLKSGSAKKVKSKKQAIAIGLAQARREGGKVPRKKTSTKKK